MLGCCGWSFIRSTTLITRIFRSGRRSPKDGDGGKRFQRRHIAGAGHHHIRLAALVVAGPFPDADAGGAVLDRRVHIEPLRSRVFTGDDHVHIMPAAQAVIHDDSRQFASGGR